jgi:hypothetical protein
VIRGPNAFYTIASTLVVDVDAALEESPAGPIERACVVPGEIAWDECNCGMIAASIRNWFLSDSFPDSSDARGSLRTTPCDQPWLVASIELQVVRCAPSPDGNVLSVSCDRLDQAASELNYDAYLTLTSVVSTLCALKDAEEIVDYTLGEQLTVGPSGGCVGSMLTVQVAVDR